MYGRVIKESVDRGVPLHKLLGWIGPMTHRQHLAWQEWDNRQWNKPSRTDHYLMLIDQEIRHVLSTKRRTLKLADSKITFRAPRPQEETDITKMTPEQIARASALCKMRIGSMFGAVIPGSASPMRDGMPDMEEDWSDD